MVSLREIPNFAIIMVESVAIVGMGAFVLYKLKDGVDNDSTAYTILGTGETVLSGIADWFDTVGDVFMGALILLLFVGVFYMLRRGQGGSGYY